jgi:hypothetical protein
VRAGLRRNLTWRLASQCRGCGLDVDLPASEHLFSLALDDAGTDCLIEMRLRAPEFPRIPFERYADDAVCRCRSAEEARALWSALGDRVAACKPALHPVAISLLKAFQLSTDRIRSQS